MDGVNNLVLSVILPIYNVENYLRQAVDAVLKTQHMDEIEIILVDDGSTDTSGKIADEYSGKKIKVFHKPNGGLSDARNYGLYHATGKYVFFMDSDDTLEENAIDIMVNQLKKYDLEVLLFDAMIVDDDGKKVKTRQNAYYTHSGVTPEKVLTGLEIIDAQLAANNDYVTTVWLGVYQRELLLREALWFEKGLLHEDEIWTQKVLVNAHRVVYVESALYQYRVRSNSIMNDTQKNYEKNLGSLIYIYNTLPDYLDWKVTDKAHSQRIKANISKRYLHAIYRFDLKRYSQKAKLIDRMKVLKNSRGYKDKIRSIILVLSIRLYCVLMSIGKKVTDLKTILKDWLIGIRDLPISIYVNYKCLPLEKARKLPIQVKWNTRIKNITRGSIDIDSKNLYRKMIRIGYQGGRFIHVGRTFIDIVNGGKLIFMGSAIIADGAAFFIDGGTVLIGDNFYSNRNLQIHCEKKITIGHENLFGWNVAIRDNDGHPVFIDGAQKPTNGDIIIGNHVWIASDVTVLKYSKLTEGSVVACNSVVCGLELENNNCLIAGIPAKIKREHVSWRE